MSSIGRRSSIANSKVPLSHSITSETACSIWCAIMRRSASPSIAPEAISIWPSDRCSRSCPWRRMASSRMPRSMSPEEISRSPSLGVRGACTETSRPAWKPIMARCVPCASSNVPVRRPRWTNCITSATETSLRLPEIPIIVPCAGWCPGETAGRNRQRRAVSLAARQLDQALQGAELAILGREQAGREQGGGGVGRQQVEQVPVLGAQDRLVVEQLEQHERADHLVLHPQGHRREHRRLATRPEAQQTVG